MTAEQIRTTALVSIGRDSAEFFLREIAAQLAELNEKFKPELKGSNAGIKLPERDPQILEKGEKLNVTRY